MRRERALKICMGGGGIAFFGWRFSRGGVSMAPESVHVYL
jgi:hypothetical protein